MLLLLLGMLLLLDSIWKKNPNFERTTTVQQPICNGCEMEIESKLSNNLVQLRIMI